MERARTSLVVPLWQQRAGMPRREMLVVPYHCKVDCLDHSVTKTAATRCLVLQVMMILLIHPLLIGSLGTMLLVSSYPLLFRIPATNPATWFLLWAYDPRVIWVVVA